MGTILWLIAAVLVIFGIVRIVQGELLLGIVLIIIGLLVGPGGVSIFASVAPAFAVIWPGRLAEVGSRLDLRGAPGPDAGSS